MRIPIKTEESHTDLHMEEKLARLGAMIDELIVKADDTRDRFEKTIEEIENRGETKLKQADLALEELKETLDRVYGDVTGAWQDLKTGTERAALKLRGK